jgi:murein DD-endopeptidase MepM/ murein hydrolase activator NlpD
MQKNSICRLNTISGKGSHVSSGFGYRRHPIDGVTKFHYGIDYDASIGDDIYAFTEGEVLVSGESESLGLYLIISHPEGFITQYFHCDKLSVHGGDHVTKGMKIAEVGETGKTTARICILNC